LDIGKAMFDGDAEITPRFDAVVQQVVNLLDKEPSILRLSYYVRGGKVELARARLRNAQAAVSALWKQRKGRYELPIESRLVGVK
jgi:hypothetical protein